MFFSLFGDMEDFFLKFADVLSQFRMLLLNKFHLLVGLASETIMDELIFNQDLIF